MQNDYTYEHIAYKLCFSFQLKLYSLDVKYWWARRSYLGVQSIHLHLFSVKKIYCMHITKVTSDIIEYQHCKGWPVPISVRKLRRLDGTVPETLYFPIIAFVHRALTVHSACAHHAFIVHSFAFSLHRSLAFTVHKAFTVRSPSVHLSFTKRSSFSFHCHSELWSWKINITILERNYDKEVGLCLF